MYGTVIFIEIEKQLKLLPPFDFTAWVESPIRKVQLGEVLGQRVAVG